MKYPRLTRQRRIEIASAVGSLYTPEDPATEFYEEMSEWLMGRRKKFPKLEDFQNREDEE